MKQTCILIMGMHRSGTSALCGTLNLLDMYLGSKLMKAANQNIKGFYENLHLYKVNEKLLKQMRSCWDDVFYTESKLNAIKDISGLEAVLKKEFQYSEVFAIKDPRLAYLFPLYTKALNNMGVDIKVIIPFRNPLEVADSLKTRNQFSQEKGMLLWAYNFLLSEKLSRDLPRVLIHFDDLIQSPQTVIKQIDHKLKLDLNSKYDAQKDKIADFLNSGLKHHNISFENLLEKVSKPIRDIVSLVPKVNEARSDTKFDDIRQQLFDNQSLFYNLDILKSTQELELTKQELQAKVKEVEQAKHAELQAKVKEVEQAKHAELQAKVKEVEQAKHAELQAKVKEVEQAKHAELQAKVKEVEQAKHAELQAKVKEVEQAKHAELQAKVKEVEQLKDELLSIYLSKSWKITKSLRTARKLFNI